MNHTKQILYERKNEIELYILHLDSVVDSTDKVLFKVLKANTILMLYNLIESVVSTGVESIRNSIYHDNTIEFDNLSDKIKKQIIKDLKKNISPENFVSLCQKVSNDIIKLSFKKESISTGNIDLKEIKNLSDIYGFSIIGSNYHDTKHGTTITDIKGKRNDLAHGTYSFAEIGKDYTLEDVKNLSIHTINFLEFLVQKIEIYLQNQDYKLQSN